MYSLISLFLLSRVYAQDNDALSILSGDTLRDVHGPVDFPTNYLYLIIILVVILAVIGFFVLHMIKTKPEKVDPGPVDPRMPWEIALDEINELKRANLIEEGLFKEYYSKLSDIVRRYFERRFQIKAPEMTTEEFLRSLEGSQDLTIDQNDVLKNFLNSCDIVKFAKYVPPVEEAKESITLAQQLIEQTKPVISSQS